MDNIPQDPIEYRAWWATNAPVPYGQCWCGCGEHTKISPHGGKRDGLVKGEPLRYLPGHHSRKKPNELIHDPEEYRRWWAEQRPDIVYGYCWCGCGEKTGIPTHNQRKLHYVRGEPVRYRPGHRSRALDRLFTTAAEYREYWHREKPDIAYGYCWCGCGRQTQIARRTHYAEYSMQGEPVRFIIGHGSRSSPVDYIERDCGHDTPCWIWQLSRNADGYGQKYENGSAHAAHRLYYERAFGPIPSKLEIDHLCEIPSCVNPTHLESVTHTENIRRGRHTKLSWADAAAIRKLRAQGMSAPKIGTMFGISGTHVYMICQHKQWKSH